MKGKRALVVGGLVAALAVPAGVAVAATAAPSPGPSASTTQPGGPGQGYGPGPGRMMGGGYGDPEDCPFHDSAEAQQWRDQRETRQQLSPEERQNLMQQHREQMWKLMNGGSTSS